MKLKRILSMLPVAAVASLALGYALGTDDTSEARHAALTASPHPSPASLGVSTPSPQTVVLEPTRAALLPEVSVDRARILAHGEAELFVLVRFEVPKPVRVAVERPPLDLALVIDRSGSMADKGKITHAREAARRLVDAMAPSDILGVVEYDDQINVLWPSSPLTSPRRVKALISGLEPRGSTNLTGGLLRGLDEARRYAHRAGINRVFLLSDGLANRGITSPSEIAALVHRARAQGIGVSTLGLGFEYNEDLMQTIAEAGGGTYYYVESPSQMSSIFERELSTLFTTVAKDVRLHFECGDGVREVEALGYDTIGQNGSVSIPLENLYGGEKRTVLLRLRIDPQSPGMFDLGSLNLGYTDCGSNEAQAANYQLRVEATADEASVQASIDIPTSAEATLMSAEEEHEQAVRDYERGEKELAKSNLAALSSRMALANTIFQDDRLDKKLEQLQMESTDMDRADLNEENRQMYLKSAKNILYNAKKGKRGQYMMQKNDTGYDVERLQTKLVELQLYSGPVNGTYTEEVRKAVENYQGQNGLAADGIAGPATLRSLGLY